MHDRVVVLMVVCATFMRHKLHVKREVAIWNPVYVDHIPCQDDEKTWIGDSDQKMKYIQHYSIDWKEYLCALSILYLHMCIFKCAASTAIKLLCYSYYVGHISFTYLCMHIWDTIASSYSRPKKVQFWHQRCKPLNCVNHITSYRLQSHAVISKHC